MPNLQVMPLSDDSVLIYILQSGVLGRLSAGRIERDGNAVINVYDRYDRLQPYFSGTKLRSWCVVGPNGLPVPSWSSILPEDCARMLHSA